jgi:hypothetical protein
VSRSSTKGRQERRGPHASSALPGRSAAARARSLQRTRAAATELAAHRRRLLATSIEGGEGEDLLSADAMLLRVGPAVHHAGLARIAEAALVFDRNGHRAFKAAASDSRPPQAAELRLKTSSSSASRAASGGEGLAVDNGIDGTPGTDGTHGPGGAPQAPPSFRPTAPSSRIVRREGKDVTTPISTSPRGRGENAIKPTGEVTNS